MPFRAYSFLSTSCKMSNISNFSLEMTDALLVSLQSFSSNSLLYSTPECVRRGVPLFCFPPNSLQPVSNTLRLYHTISANSASSMSALFIARRCWSWSKESPSMFFLRMLRQGYFVFIVAGFSLILENIQKTCGR